MPFLFKMKYECLCIPLCIIRFDYIQHNSQPQECHVEEQASSNNFCKEYFFFKRSQPLMTPHSNLDILSVFCYKSLHKSQSSVNNCKSEIIVWHLWKWLHFRQQAMLPLPLHYNPSVFKAAATGLCTYEWLQKDSFRYIQLLRCKLISSHFAYLRK